ncbi:MAG: 3-isopropylmalate dehydratase small subunit [Oligoflexales bacterium]|nr:3-isopropylmalate dehydratase small subunit [Oligoflexales bacterium]
MKAFDKLCSRAICLPLKDVDTDMIIPAQHLTSTSREGFGENLFERLRAASSDFIFNHGQAKGSQILISGPNFGCGSSREHAVWALMDFGIRAIVAPSFSDIFANNAAKNGLLLIRLDADKVSELDQQLSNFSQTLSIDLKEQVLSTSNGIKHSFVIDAFNKERLLKGMDDLDYLVAHMSDIEAFKSKQKIFLNSHSAG